MFGPPVRRAPGEGKATMQDILASLRAEIAATMPASPAQLAGQFRARMAGIAASHDRQEGLAAFRERRAPRFEGR